MGRRKPVEGTLGGFSVVGDLETPAGVGRLLADHFRCAEDVAGFTTHVDRSLPAGYFRLGPDTICFGQCSGGVPAESPTASLHDALHSVTTNHASVHLPFDPAQVVDNLRCERYQDRGNGTRTLSGRNPVRELYYLIRPLMPVAVRKHLQKAYLRGWDKVPFPKWPVDHTVENLRERLLILAMKVRHVDRVPFIWFWPNGAASCSVVTHDVETGAGVDFSPQLMDLNDSYGIKSSFQVVPEERYPVRPEYLENIRQRGFEVNVHDLNHDGQLYSDRQQFLQRAEQINRYGREFGAVGFRAAVLYRNQDWFDALDFEYDMSIPNVAHLDPQRGGCCTVFPFFIGNILEIPVTVIQDYSLFHILNDYSIDVWKDQIARIRAKNGLFNVIIHPDYIIDERARRVYAELLQYLSDMRSKQQTWIALPRDVSAWWRQRSKMELVNDGGAWRIEGDGSERARMAYAVLAGDSLRYEFAPAQA